MVFCYFCIPFTGACICFMVLTYNDLKYYRCKLEETDISRFQLDEFIQSWFIPLNKQMNGILINCQDPIVKLIPKWEKGEEEWIRKLPRPYLKLDSNENFHDELLTIDIIELLPQFNECE